MSANETFWSLVERKVINPSSRRDGSVTISAGSSVGLARCGDLTVRVREKVPGALEALLSRRLAGVKTISLPGMFTHEDTLIDRVVTLFVAAVTRYVEGGRGWAYENFRRKGSVIGGRLLIRETLALRASGRPQIAAFEKRHITHITPANQCIAAALRVTEDLYHAGLLGESAIAEARVLAPFFHDNNTADVLFGAPRRHAQRAVDLAETVGGETGQLLHLAAILLFGAGMDPLGSDAGHLPITWFINLEDAFEVGVREAFTEFLKGVWRVEKGRDHAYLFPAVSHLNVSPDLILTRIGSQTRIVGDVKYKNLEGKPRASDLYQLLAHATSLSSNTAFLVYPSTSFGHISLGVSTTGVSVDVFTVDILKLDHAVARIAGALLHDLGS
ncbi:5-methylcytosine restriction system specificity protein McrC [Nocardia canadensis]|uniref:5-methylcytosine restriction system specificity protein McrC n=1 Tax=Nocardia canadensis TaxID=3065238 RepID=UPI002930CECC|nr:hypothetical protein [Nocardia canadensis]